MMSLHEQALKQIESKRNELQSKLAELDAAERYHRGELGANVNGVERTVKPVHVRRKRTGGMTRVEAAKTVLESAEGPMAAKSVATAMLESKLATGDVGKVTRSVYQAMLGRPQEFKRAGRGLWTLR